MSPAPSYTLPTISNPNSTEDPLIRTSLSDLKTLLTDGLDDSNIATGGVGTTSLASNAVTTAKITDANVTTAKITDANVTDAKLASPNNSVYHTVASLPWLSIGAFATGTYIASENAAGRWVTSGSISGGLLGAFDFASGDYTVTGLTTKFRVQMQALVGTTSPSTVTFNGGLYPITSSAGDFTRGTVVTGSTTGTTATPSLATSTISRYASSDFSASALLTDPGTYALGVVVGSITVPAAIAVRLVLQTRNT